MVREPNLKDAVKIVRAEFAEMGIKLPYQKTLDVVAKSKGYSGYEHYLQVNAAVSKDAASTDVAESDKPFSVELLFGTERVFDYQNGTLEERTAALDETDVYFFATEAELEAFKEGVEAAEGWLDYEEVTSEDRERALTPDETVTESDGDEDDEDAEVSGDGWSTMYRNLRVRVFLPTAEFDSSVLNVNGLGRHPVEESISVSAAYAAEDVRLEEIPYQGPLKYVLTNLERGVYVFEVEVQVMFEARSDDAVQGALENMDYKVTYGPEKRVLQSEIIGW